MDYNRLVDENNDLKKELEMNKEKGRSFTFGNQNYPPEKNVPKNFRTMYQSRRFITSFA